MNEEKIVCGIFGEDDIGAIAKTRLITAVSKQHILIQRLVVELFCENPGHDFFNQYTDAEKIPYIKEFERRCSTRIQGQRIRDKIRNKVISYLVKTYVPVRIIHDYSQSRKKNTKRI